MNFINKNIHGIKLRISEIASVFLIYKIRNFQSTLNFNNFNSGRML